MADHAALLTNQSERSKATEQTKNKATQSNQTKPNQTNQKISNQPNKTTTSTKQTKPTKPIQRKQNRLRTNNNQTKPNQAKPSQAKPNQPKPTQPNQPTNLPTFQLSYATTFRNSIRPGQFWTFLRVRATERRRLVASPHTGGGRRAWWATSYPSTSRQFPRCRWESRRGSSSTTNPRAPGLYPQKVVRPAWHPPQPAYLRRQARSPRDNHFDRFRRAPGS